MLLFGKSCCVFIAIVRSSKYFITNSYRCRVSLCGQSMLERGELTIGDQLVKRIVMCILICRNSWNIHGFLFLGQATITLTDQVIGIMTDIDQPTDLPLEEICIRQIIKTSTGLIDVKHLTAEVSCILFTCKSVKNILRYEWLPLLFTVS